MEISINNDLKYSLYNSDIAKLLDISHNHRKHEKEEIDLIRILNQLIIYFMIRIRLTPFTHQGAPSIGIHFNLNAQIKSHITELESVR